MKILEKLAAKNKSLWEHSTISIAFFGDSVTQGCFEIFQKDDGGIETIFEQHNNYGHALADILAQLYPIAPVQIINAGMSGDNAPHAFKRLERDVLRFSPDLTVVCFGLNDSTVGMDFLPKYVQALEDIFRKLKAAGTEIIFMTPNMMNTHVSCHIKEDWAREYAERNAKVQNSGTLDAFLEAAKVLCQKEDIPVCDCYAIWKKLYENGVDTDELLSNRLNHPTRPMQKLFAYELARTIFEN